MDVQYHFNGDLVLQVNLGGPLTIETNRRMLQFAETVASANIPGIQSIIPAMTSFSIKYEPRKVGITELISHLQQLQRHIGESPSIASKRVVVPVAFSEKYGLDIPYIQEKTGLGVEEMVERMTRKPFHVYMLGFIAGLPYMGEIDPELRLPRRATPRIEVAKGSIAIANELTNIYTESSPGGWHVIGWTPMATFDIDAAIPTIVQAGDEVLFKEISTSEAEQWDTNKQREWDETWNPSLLKSQDF
ncbi:5-oxoprolinase subunit B family protein [Shouchella clausii]|uniref:5-oxoprolinase subunit B family protein n=1 Tax=Shouchella clausii TaxID=79880 RepID=UPI0007922878|nr:carboxyltransferase domain-containing protein [Shouchella clausii]KKI85121.1 hypothetical protein WZ76_16835 [Shouchella clausii]